MPNILELEKKKGKSLPEIQTQEEKYILKNPYEGKYHTPKIPKYSEIEKKENIPHATIPYTGYTPPSTNLL